MGLDDIILPDAAEGWSQSAEISEKYKESVKKAGAWIRRTQKDEGKAKQYDFLLAKFLVELILLRKFDSLLDELFSCFDLWYGANFLLWILSLVHIPISNEIRRVSGKVEIVFHYHTSADGEDFHEQKIPDEIRSRVNYWIEDMESVLSLEVSTLITQRTLGLILYDERIRQFTTQVFLFFFQELNIRISAETAKSYSQFILSQLEKSMKENFKEMEKQWSDEWLEI